MINYAAKPIADYGVADYQRLVEELTLAARAYYNTDTMMMTDAEYDQRLEIVSQLESRHPEWGKAAITQAVAGGEGASGKVQHPTPMLSLEKAHRIGEVEEFLEKLEDAQVVVEPKLDGMAIRAEYRRGELVLVAIRGDGNTGDEVTEKAPAIRGLPTQLPEPLDLEVRGEVYMTDDNFRIAVENRLRAGKPAFVNPRNATAGVLLTKTRKYEAPMSFAAYGVNQGGDSYFESMEWLQTLGFATAATLITGAKRVAANEPEQIATRIDELMHERPRLGFPIDGAVIKVDSEAVRQRIGEASRAPRWALAYKYPPDTALSTLRDIELGVGRTGRVSVRARLDPVVVGGATVTYATLHYPQFVQAADLRIGDKVWVYRAGDVIPQITAPELTARPPDLNPWVPPDDCPQCESPLLKEGLLWRCETPTCSLGGHVRYFASRDIMDIEGLDEMVTEALLESGRVRNIADLYDLEVADLATLQMGVTSTGKPRLLGTTVASKIVQSIEDSRQQPFSRVIAGLGIRGTGRSMSRRLASNFHSMDNLRAASIAELAEVEGIGEIKASLIFQELKKMADLIDRLAEAGLQMRSEANSPTTDNVLLGKRVVVTGGVPGMSRTEAQEAVEKMGGIATSGVSSKVDIVIAGEGAGSKLSKAQALGIPVMDAQEFAALLHSTEEIGIV